MGIADKIKNFFGINKRKKEEKEPGLVQGLKQTQKDASIALISATQTAEAVQDVAENANEIMEDNKKRVKIAIGLSIGFLAMGIVADVISIGCCISTNRANKRPVIINNYLGGRKK